MNLILLLALLGFSPTPAEAAIISSTTVEYSSTTAPLVLEAFAYRYGIDANEFRKVAECESHLNEKAWNKLDPNTGSKGVFQFQDATFAHYSKEVGIVNPDVFNPWHNIETAAYMFSKGEQKQWTCYRKLFGGKGV